MTYINKRNIYGNEYNACALCEYQRELKLIKRLINISEKAVERQTPTNAWSYERICHSFAKTIVDYSKMAYDNVLLGHFHAVNMIIRTVLENLVCLDIIVNNQELELWKYYWAYSYRETIYKSGRTPTQDQLDFLQGSVFVGDMMVMFVNIYMNLYRMVTMYCWDKVDEDFDDVTDELDWIFNRFVQHEEEVYGNT